MQAAVLLNEFDQKFQELERRTGNDPSKIDWLVSNSSEIRRLVGELYWWEINFKKYILDRLLLETHAWFVDRYRKYSKLYSPVIQRVYGDLHLSAIFEDEVHGIPAKEILFCDRDYSGDRGFKYFIPEIRDGAESIEFVWRFVHDTSDGSTRDEWLDEELSRGVEAWDYFTETIGIDLPSIEHRWGKLPRALIPIDRTLPVIDRRLCSLNCSKRRRRHMSLVCPRLRWQCAGPSAIWC